ncbi:MAG TPA: ATP-binding protein, partial [Candidatus Hydrogenedentes bacterium]|nr:ATP-binding protein [Candidatus Hydrogenedentota bacterium]
TAGERYGRDLARRSITDLLHNDEHAEELEGLRQALERGEPFTRCFIRPAGGSRDKRTDEVRMVPVRSPNGDLISYAVIVRDITDQVRHQTQMQHVQKLESIGVLAGGIAHDFNNLLMTILGNTDLAMQEAGDASAILGYLREIEKASQHAADLCRQMLAYAGKGQIQVSNVDLNSLIDGMTRLLEISVSKKVVIRQNLFPGLPPVKADASQLRQILMNLVLNASEAIGNKSGVILISTGVMACDHQYLAGTFVSEPLPEGDYVYIEVSDTGCGIPPEHRDRIFDPFFTTKFLGRGLGLAAVLGIVRSHGGAIKVYSEVDKGTTFKVLLPVAPGAAVIPQPSRVETRWSGHGTVLLAEDEETVRTLGRRMLERMGFTVIAAVDGRDCLRLFQAHAKELRLVLLDLTMPHLDGDEVFREVRRARPDLPTIIASGYTEQEIRQRFAGKGIAGFIQKPYHLNDLRDVIRHALGE